MGRSVKIRDAIELVKRVAPSDIPVLIEGESGTGKELFARFLHDKSMRADGPLLAINCAALTETLLESELFGHVRGAFTGAVREHPGLFRSASKGTLMLDEIGEMPTRMQSRLLRVLQEKRVKPVGGEQTIEVDVRIVAATNRDLEAEVEAGRFRQDLYFRLAGLRVQLPPLRERRDDIIEIAERMLTKIAGEPGMKAVGLSAEALRALLAHDWPGNVRELEQVLRRAVLIAEGDDIEVGDLQIGKGRGLSRRAALRQLDSELVADALKAASGNKSKAAKALGVSRPTLYRWIDRYGLE